MSSPLVSVVIPAFNAASTLPVTLRSVLDQRHRDIEVLVVDDGSSDATPDVIARCVAADARVRGLGDGVNRGRSAARNRAIDESVGDWVAFVDADDLWHPDRLTSLLAAAERFPSSSVVFDDRIGFRVVDTPTGGSGGSGAGGVRVELDHRFVSRSTWRVGTVAPVERHRWMADKFCHMDPLVRRALLIEGGPRYPEDLGNAEDLSFCMQLAFWPSPTVPVRVGTPGYYYRQTATVRSAGTGSSTRRAVDVAAAVTGSAELAEIARRGWAGHAWRFDRFDASLAADGRLGERDPGAVDAAVAPSTVAGLVSLVQEKGLQRLGRWADRDLRADVVADLERQLTASSTWWPTSPS